MEALKQRVVILAGGGYDPNHVSHLRMINRAHDVIKPDVTYIAASGVKAGSSPGHMRVRMLQLAIGRRNRRFKLCNYEVEHPGSVSLDTIAELRRLEGQDVKIVFLMGEDNINVLINYPRRTEFLNACQLLICPRSSKDPVDELQARWRRLLPDAQDLMALDCPADELASTIIRRWVAAGQSIRYLVVPAVDRYIKRNKLYVNPNRDFKVHHGVLHGFWETGTEGVQWTLYDEAKQGYEGLYCLEAGDHLTVYDHDNSVVWEGIINPEYKTGWQRYPRNPKHGQQCALGMWVHWNQRGFKNIDKWAEMFFAGNLKKNNRFKGPLRAIVVENLAGLPRK